VDRGWLVHKLVEFQRSDGSLGSRDQVYFTPAGAAKMAVLIEKHRQSEAGAR
jgi:hypothetical protein